MNRKRLWIVCLLACLILLTAGAEISFIEEWVFQNNINPTVTVSEGSYAESYCRDCGLT